MLSCEVPGVSIARSIQRRDATGRSWICCVDTAVDTSDLVVSTIGDSATTLTTSDNAAGFNMKLMTASWSITRITSGRRSVVKPCISAVSEYLPGGRAGTRYTPVGSVTTL